MKGIIFDLDGVIVRTDKVHYKAWKTIADKENIYFDETINNRLRGVSRVESLNIILERADKKYSQEEKNEIAEEKNLYYVELLGSMNKENILPGVEYTLNQLKSKNVKIAIGSSSKNASTILKRVGLDNFFDAVADGSHITNSKPDPEVFLLAAKQLGLSPADCGVVEDAEAGIIAANDGEMTSFAIGDAVNCGKADHNLVKIEDLLQYIY